MSENIQMQWLIEKRVRLLTLPNHFTTEAFQTFDDETCLMMDTLSHPFLHVIMDVQGLETFPPLNICIKIRSIRHERMGWLLSVGATLNPLIRFFLSTAVTAARIRYKNFDSVHEAISFLQAYDPALPPIEIQSVVL